ncbi:hypothetical protein LXA43DRAFT_1186854 [Ganoderma leucocontextum]|nr:hypothetical protein LXA43DRAFT_1186854 [Ganoderma leucocontextum]
MHSSSRLPETSPRELLLSSDRENWHATFPRCSDGSPQVSRLFDHPFLCNPSSNSDAPPWFPRHFALLLLHSFFVCTAFGLVRRFSSVHPPNAQVCETLRASVPVRQLVDFSASRRFHTFFANFSAAAFFAHCSDRHETWDTAPSTFKLDAGRVLSPPRQPFPRDSFHNPALPRSHGTSLLRVVQPPILPRFARKLLPSSAFALGDHSKFKLVARIQG